MADKLDLAELWKSDFAAPRRPVVLEIKLAVYLAIEGRGEPGGADFTARIGALYGMAYTIKMTRKFGGLQDYTISKLEAQWWGRDGESDFAALPKADWRWRLMIRTPEFVTDSELAAARTALHKRGKDAGTQDVHLFRFSEGPCVQMLHVGPYEQEPATVEKMRVFAGSRTMHLHGLHHEIYISDPRRVAPERLKTILRRPVLVVLSARSASLQSIPEGAQSHSQEQHTTLRLRHGGHFQDQAVECGYAAA